MKLPLTTVPNVHPIDWEGLHQRFMNPGELEVLCALVRNTNAKGVLEIGCNEGRTAAAILRECPTVERYQGIDVTPGYQFAKRVQRAEIPKKPGHYAMHDPRFELILKARGSFELATTDLPLCDVVFIDGDHAREAVEHDTKLAVSLVREGGMIVWHDYHDKDTVDVREVLDELFTSGWDIQHVRNTWLAFMVQS